MRQAGIRMRIAEIRRTENMIEFDDAERKICGDDEDAFEAAEKRNRRLTLNLEYQDLNERIIEDSL
jgi:hypothetical protein